jgi:hypothetical protein
VGVQLSGRILLVACVVALTTQGCGSSPAGFEVDQLTDGGIAYWPAAVSGDRVVWAGRDDTDGGDDLEIFTWTPADGTVQVTHNDFGDRDPIVSGDQVVWIGGDLIDGTDETELFSWTPADGVVQITADSTDVVFFSCSQGRVVWQDGEGGDAAIFTWTRADGAVLLADNGQGYRPKVSGDRVVWWGWPGGEDEEAQIYTWTPSGGTVQLSDGGCAGAFPDVCGDRVVWSGRGGSDGGKDREVFTWTPAEGVLQVTSNELDDFLPTVSSDRIVWGGDGVGSGIVTWTPEGGIVPVVEYGDNYVSFPSVSGDRLVWGQQTDGANSDSEIFTWTPENGVVRLTSNNEGDAGAQVSGDRIVWVGERQGFRSSPRSMWVCEAASRRVGRSRHIGPRASPAFGRPAGVSLTANKRVQTDFLRWLMYGVPWPTGAAEAQRR